MDLNDPLRYYHNDPFILDGYYPPFGIYVGRIGNVYAFRTNQKDGCGSWLWNPVGCWEVNAIEKIVEEFYENL